MELRRKQLSLRKTRILLLGEFGEITGAFLEISRTPNLASLSSNDLQDIQRLSPIVYARLAPDSVELLSGHKFVAEFVERQICDIDGYEVDSGSILKAYRICHLSSAINGVARAENAAVLLFLNDLVARGTSRRFNSAECFLSFRKL